MTYKKYNVPRGTMEQYIELLLKWNKKINLVSIKNEQELIERHVLDSLQLIDYIDKSKVIFDIGSGAGFPGLMLSYAGAKEINLVEKISKKASFLRVAATLSKNKVNVYNQAVENIEAKNCDIITARGLASLDNIFTLTTSIRKKNTQYILQKGRNIEEEIKNALEKWSFKYIIHQSKTSADGYILEVEQLETNAKTS